MDAAPEEFLALETTQVQDGSSPQLWQECLRQLAGRVKKQTFHTWFEPIRATSADEGNLVLEVSGPAISVSSS